MTPKYAREGYLFYRVSTPSVFREYELPEDEEAEMTAEEKAHLEELIDLADAHRTHIDSSPFECG